MDDQVHTSYSRTIRLMKRACSRQADLSPLNGVAIRRFPVVPSHRPAAAVRFGETHRFLLPRDSVWLAVLVWSGIPSPSDFTPQRPAVDSMFTAAVGAWAHIEKKTVASFSSTLSLGIKIATTAGSFTPKAPSDTSRAPFTPASSDDRDRTPIPAASLGLSFWRYPLHLKC